ncbi:proline hydroxylase [Pseudomonas sp. MWU13-2625]|nr:proline hydroxylase [Pseudomonas sp. MWU13-2625]
MSMSPSRLDALDWPSLEQQLDQYGYAIIRSLLPAPACERLSALYSQTEPFRSQVIMARHGFGRGEYKYFRYPLPPPLERLRNALYPRLMPLANRWYERMNLPVRFPATHAEFLQQCHAAGQLRPTPLLLQYGPQDYNCLHQDLYGELVFPLQVAILLSAPGQDFTGGEFVMTEQRPRMQSRPHVVDLHKGDAVLFAVNQRPVRGTRGDYRVTMRHGVSRLHSGNRHTLGIIFHDAS